MHSPVVRHDTRDDHRIYFSQIPYRGCRGVDCVYMHVCKRVREKFTLCLYACACVCLQCVCVRVCVFTVCVCVFVLT